MALAAPSTEQPAAQTGPTAPPGGPSGQTRKLFGHTLRLREALQRLYTLRPSREAFGEEAIQLIAKAAGVRAAALLRCEGRDEGLSVLAAVGLEPDTLQALGSEAGRSMWDIPLRSLRSRRIHVIESAHGNPFVPNIIKTISPRRLTIAIIPFYQASAPVGSLILFAATPRGFADTLLRVLTQALRVCAAAMADLPSSAEAETLPGAERPREQPALLRGLSALKSELARLAQALEETERLRAEEAAERVTAQSFLRAERERTEQLQKKLAELQAEQQRLSSLEEEQQELSQATAEARAEAASVRSRVEELEATLTEAQEKIETSAATVETLTQVRSELEEQLQQSRSAIEEQEAAAAIANARIEKLSAGEHESEQLRGALAEAEETRTALQEDLDRSRAELAALREERAQLDATVQKTEAALQDSRTQERSLVTQLAEAQAQSAQLQKVQEGLSETQAQLAAVEEERNALARRAEEARDALDETSKAREDLQGRLQAALEQADQSQAASSETAGRIAELEKTLQEASAARDALVAELGEAEERGQAKVASLAEALEQLKTDSQAQRTEMAEQRELAERRYVTECERLAADLAEKEMLLTAAEERMGALDWAEAEDQADSVLAIERSSAPEQEAVSDQAEAAAVAVEAEPITILDDGEIGECLGTRLADFGIPFSVQAPAAALLEQWRSQPPACAAVNLASDGAWEIVRSLGREPKAPRFPLVAYALGSNTSKGVWVGRVDFTSLPIAEGALEGMLYHLAPQVRRILAMSNDIDVMTDVRAQLAETRISAAVVLDGRQTLDLIPTIRPEAAVLHLSPACTDVFRAVAGLRDTEITRNVPLLFLLDGDADKREASFLKGGTQMLVGRGKLEADEIGDLLASTVQA